MASWVVRLAAAWTLLACPATAQDAQNYVYDSQGRLIGSTRASSAPNDIVGYSFDDADNRTQRFASVAARSSLTNELLPGETMVAGQSLTSPNGQATVILQTDGNFVLYKPSGAISVTGAGIGRSLLLAMQTDGNLVLYSPSLAPIWFQTFSQPGTRLVLQNDCNLVLYNGGTPLWSTGTSC